MMHMVVFAYYDRIHQLKAVYYQYPEYSASGLMFRTYTGDTFKKLVEDMIDEVSDDALGSIDKIIIYTDTNMVNPIKSFAVATYPTLVIDVQDVSKYGDSYIRQFEACKNLTLSLS